MKIYGYGLMIVYIFYFFNFMKKDNLYIDKLKIILLPISLGILWLVKSYLKDWMFDLSNKSILFH